MFKPALGGLGLKGLSRASHSPREGQEKMLQVDPWGTAQGLDHPWPLLQPFLLCPGWVSRPDDEGLSLSLSQVRP